ncbi:hypothetical protein SAMN06265222_107307 [Neorhodopirellula lusitana]|uniref:NusG domain-containing protein n=1 Tax=Neorhodopirellula lusitana TaxID=445327 RepID=A0ABY1QAG9_9BACT|nr:hypothetical protein [Neorhodopirellula lusitana]SMP62380.1 hypothetical protein SAMN06265222_107307 [Neorhodopirellula lusitana]
MQTKVQRLFTFLVVAVLAITAYSFAVAGDPSAPGPDNYLTRFHGKTILVVLDLGSDGIERTVLVDASLTGLGDKRFLGGVVTDKYPEFPVIMPGRKAFVALDRVVSIQVLEGSDR